MVRFPRPAIANSLLPRYDFMVSIRLFCAVKHLKSRARKDTENSYLISVKYKSICVIIG